MKVVNVHGCRHFLVLSYSCWYKYGNPGIFQPYKHHFMSRNRSRTHWKHPSVHWPDISESPFCASTSLPIPETMGWTRVGALHLCPVPQPWTQPTRIHAFAEKDAQDKLGTWTIDELVWAGWAMIIEWVVGEAAATTTATCSPRILASWYMGQGKMPWDPIRILVKSRMSIYGSARK